jgi:hypothetical protein
MKAPAGSISLGIAFIAGYFLVSALTNAEKPASVTASQPGQTAPHYQGVVPHVPGVSDEGMRALMDGIDRQVKEDYPEMMENVRTSPARMEAARQQVRDAEERLRQSYEPSPEMEAADQRLRDARERLRRAYDE